MKENATKHLASLFVGETNHLKSGGECIWKSEEKKVSKLHGNVCEFENVCKYVFDRRGGKFLCGEYDPGMGVFQITEMTYKALVENRQTDTEEHA